MFGFAEGEQKDKQSRAYLNKTIAENFPNLGRDLAIPVHEAYSSYHYLNLK